MALYYFTAELNGQEVPLAGFSVNAFNSSLTVDVTLPSNESYADIPPGSVIKIKYGSKIFTEAVYAGFAAAKTSYQYSQTLQFLHPVNILLNAPFAFPITGISRSVYEAMPDYILYKVTGGKDLGDKGAATVPASFFAAMVSENVDNLLALFSVIRKWSVSFNGLCQRYLDRNEKLKNSLAKININIKSSAQMLALLCERERFETPTFIDVQWILNTLLMYTNQAIFCQPDGTITVGLADGVELPAAVRIRQADIEQVSINYSWIQPTTTVAFLSQSPQAELDPPVASVVYNGVLGKCVSGYNFEEIEGMAANTTFGNYSPVSISISVPYLAQSELKSMGLNVTEEDQYRTACSFAKRHYWRLYKSTNNYELVVPFGLPFLMGNVVGRTCAFGLNNKIFFGQIVGVSHVWNASGESYSKVLVQGVKGYIYDPKDKNLAPYASLIDPKNEISPTTMYESTKLPTRKLTCF